MTYRTFNSIFPSYYVEVPSEEYVRQRCLAHLMTARVYRDIYEWIKRMTCPYQREAYATLMIDTMCDASTNENEDERLSGDALEEVEPKLKVLIKSARSEQLAEEHLTNDANANAPAPTPANPHSTIAEHVSELEKQMAVLSKEVAELKENATENKHFTLPDDWFAAGIADDDRLTIERMLYDLCNSNKRSASADIKSYMRLKAQAGQIIRPTQLNSEWETLRSIGYKRTYSTYHNAGD